MSSVASDLKESSNAKRTFDDALSDCAHHIRRAESYRLRAEAKGDVLRPWDQDRLGDLKRLLKEAETLCFEIEGLSDEDEECPYCGKSG